MINETGEEGAQIREKKEEGRKKRIIIRTPVAKSFESIQ